MPDITDSLFERGVFCNRTLNLKSIRAIGYDMDYTLIHYKVDAWEGQAYEYTKRTLLKKGWDIEDLEFDPDIIMQGLIIDTQLGNIVKADRFGYLKQAAHGTKMIDFKDMRKIYSETLVDLSNSRYVFLNTFFSISEGCIYSQLVDLLDQARLPGVMGYEDLYQNVRSALDRAHVEGALKAEIIANPENYVEIDPKLVMTLLDQKYSGKKMLLITNSEWAYTRFMMSYTCDRFLPSGMTWRSLFNVIIVSARKPDFFTGNSPAFKIVTEDGLLQPCIGNLQEGQIYLGGNAKIVQNSLNIDGEEILYIGDHILYDVNITKNVLSWRTALIMRDMEQELRAVETSKELHGKLNEMMKEKEALEALYNQKKLIIQRNEYQYGNKVDLDIPQVKEEMRQLRNKIESLDDKISTLIVEDSVKVNMRWGYFMRAGNDKSHLARQIERYADVYTSRVSNFLDYSPFMYFRSHRGSLPHDSLFYETKDPSKTNH